MPSTGRLRRVTWWPARCAGGCASTGPTTRHGKTATASDHARMVRCSCPQLREPTALREVASSQTWMRSRKGAVVGPKKVTLRNGEVRWEVGYYDAGRGSARRRRRFQRREDAQTFLDEM